MGHNEIVEYKLIYKYPNTAWKSFTFEADGDMEAILKAGNFANEMNYELYQLERVVTITKRLI